MTWEDVQNTYRDLGFRAATEFEKRQKELKKYWSNRGLFGSSFYQEPYDQMREEYDDYRSDLNNEFLNLNNERINRQARGELPEQVLQRQQFDNSYKRLLAEQEAGRKEQQARRFAAVQPSQILDGNKVGVNTWEDEMIRQNPWYRKKKLGY